MVYKWRYFDFPVDANVVGKHVEQIEKRDGAVTAESLLAEARPKKSELHGLFEWNDDVAAEKYRLSQASKVICALAVVSEDPKENIPVRRAFVNIGTRKSGQFIGTMLAMSQEETRETVLRHAFEELSAFQQKYRGLKELAAILDDIDQLKLNLQEAT